MAKHETKKAEVPDDGVTKPTKTRMIGKRELVANGIRNQAQINEYILKKGNEHRKVSDKTAYKARRGWLKKWVSPRKRKKPPVFDGGFHFSNA